MTTKEELSPTQQIERVFNEEALDRFLEKEYLEMGDIQRAGVWDRIIYNILRADADISKGEGPVGEAARYFGGLMIIRAAKYKEYEEGSRYLTNKDILATQGFLELPADKRRLVMGRIKRGFEKVHQEKGITPPPLPV